MNLPISPWIDLTIDLAQRCHHLAWFIYGCVEREHMLNVDPRPTGWDELRLYRLGQRSDDLAIGAWPASGTANGARTVVLPVGLPRGAYELRLFSPVPDYTGLPNVVARSQQIYSGQ